MKKPKRQPTTKIQREDLKFNVRVALLSRGALQVNPSTFELCEGPDFEMMQYCIADAGLFRYVMNLPGNKRTIGNPKWKDDPKRFRWREHSYVFWRNLSIMKDGGKAKKGEVQKYKLVGFKRLYPTQ
jgi:hypothetical protein